MLVWIYPKQTQLLFQDKRKLDVILQRLKEVGITLCVAVFLRNDETI